MRTNIVRYLLVVDDDDVFRGFLIKTLKNQGYRVLGIRDPDTLATTIAIHKPDVVLLDMMFDGGADGLEACRKLRLWSSIPVVIISALNDETSKVAALDSGADDYLSKPFGINELLARLRAIERRLIERNHDTSNTIVIDRLTIDIDDWKVTLAEKPIRVSKKEFVLLKLLADAQGQPVSYEKLMAELWPDSRMFEKSKVRGLIVQLRRKLEDDFRHPRYILTEAGAGYRLNMDKEF
jgi:two-component system, OmpR family, KDP operon response regulator KdpE